jgi:hypothetical protein
VQVFSDPANLAVCGLPGSEAHASKGNCPQSYEISANAEGIVFG